MDALWVLAREMTNCPPTLKDGSMRELAFRDHFKGALGSTAAWNRVVCGVQRLVFKVWGSTERWLEGNEVHPHSLPWMISSNSRL